MPLGASKMENIKEFYIIGEPIETRIGKLYPVKVKEYPYFSKYINTLLFDKRDLLFFLKGMVSQNSDLQPLLDLANELSLFDFVMYFSGEIYRGSFLYDLYQQYKELFKFCFKEDVFDKVEDNDEFEYYINLIKEFNDIHYEKMSHNPEIARFEMYKKRMAEAKGELITFEAMYTSILLSSNTHPNDMTLYQFNKAFDRIMHYKANEATTLFATVSSEVDIVPWYGTKTKEQKSFITEEQLKQAKLDKQNRELQRKL